MADFSIVETEQVGLHGGCTQSRYFVNIRQDGLRPRISVASVARELSKPIHRLAPSQVMPLIVAIGAGVRTG
jgi:hypothetical protein